MISLTGNDNAVYSNFMVSRMYFDEIFQYKQILGMYLHIELPDSFLLNTTSLFR